MKFFPILLFSGLTVYGGLPATLTVDQFSGAIIGPISSNQFAAINGLGGGTNTNTNSIITLTSSNGTIAIFPTNGVGSNLDLSLAVQGGSLTAYSNITSYTFTTYGQPLGTLDANIVGFAYLEDPYLTNPLVIGIETNYNEIWQGAGNGTNGLYMRQVGFYTNSISTVNGSLKLISSGGMSVVSAPSGISLVVGTNTAGISVTGGLYANGNLLYSLIPGDQIYFQTNGLYPNQTLTINSSAINNIQPGIGINFSYGGTYPNEYITVNANASSGGAGSGGGNLAAGTVALSGGKILVTPGVDVETNNGTNIGYVYYAGTQSATNNTIVASNIITGLGGSFQLVSSFPTDTNLVGWWISTTNSTNLYQWGNTNLTNWGNNIKINAQGQITNTPWTIFTNSLASYVIASNYLSFNWSNGNSVVLSNGGFIYLSGNLIDNSNISAVGTGSFNGISNSGFTYYLFDGNGPTWPGGSYWREKPTSQILLGYGPQGLNLNGGGIGTSCLDPLYVTGAGTGEVYSLLPGSGIVFTTNTYTLTIATSGAGTINTNTLTNNIPSTNLYNTFVGQGSGQYAATGGSNTTLGWLAGVGLTGPSGYNTFLGVAAGESDTSGQQNTYIGKSAGQSSSTGNYNTAIGYSALTQNLTASENTAIGFDAGWQTRGANNTIEGYEALYSNVNGVDNVAIGYQSLYYSVGLGYNVAMGWQAGASITNSTNCICIGAGSGPLNDVLGTNSLWLGNSNTANTYLFGNINISSNINYLGFVTNGATVNTGYTNGITTMTSSNELTWRTNAIVLSGATWNSTTNTWHTTNSGLIHFDITVAANDNNNFVNWHTTTATGAVHGQANTSPTTSLSIIAESGNNLGNLTLTAVSGGFYFSLAGTGSDTMSLVATIHETEAGTNQVVTPSFPQP